MERVSHTKIAHILKEAGEALVSVTAERDKLAEENALLKRRADCEKLASRMHARGLESDKEPEELVEHLEKEAAAGRFETIQTAVDLYGPNMSLGSTAKAHDAGGGTDPLTSYLLGRVG
jgi:hypothetical protein